MRGLNNTITVQWQVQYSPPLKPYIAYSTEDQYIASTFVTYFFATGGQLEGPTTRHTMATSTSPQKGKSTSNTQHATRKTKT